MRLKSLMLSRGRLYKVWRAIPRPWIRYITATIILSKLAHGYINTHGNSTQTHYCTPFTTVRSSGKIAIIRLKNLRKPIGVERVADKFRNWHHKMPSRRKETINLSNRLAKSFLIFVSQCSQCNQTKCFHCLHCLTTFSLKCQHLIPFLDTAVASHSHAAVPV